MKITVDKDIHDQLLEIARLVLEAKKDRSLQDWQIMHMDLSEAAEKAETRFKVIPPLIAKPVKDAS
ncbi:hypothetical protein [Rhodoferax sp. GW822-FHT02A01]|uniref:hypothetical protein n=1 Tax=Rhodoferax sp. GW822-FHT02A01 TaxID=3141537 RepID=UPI00315D8C41